MFAETSRNKLWIKDCYFRKKEYYMIEIFANKGPLCRFEKNKLKILIKL